MDRGLIMIDLANCYHHGILVPSLDAAMDEVGDVMGATWCTPVEGPQHVWLPGEGVVTWPLRFTYSSQGPVHLELIEGAPGTMWDGVASPGLHHMGVWSADLVADAQRCLDAGWRVVLAQQPPEHGYGVFVYVQPPAAGLIVELVRDVVRPVFERWFAGGPLA